MTEKDYLNLFEKLHQNTINNVACFLLFSLRRTIWGITPNLELFQNKGSLMSSSSVVKYVWGILAKNINSEVKIKLKSLSDWKVYPLYKYYQTFCVLVLNSFQQWLHQECYHDNNCVQYNLKYTKAVTNLTESYN